MCPGYWWGNKSAMKKLMKSLAYLAVAFVIGGMMFLYYYTASDAKTFCAQVTKGMPLSGLLEMAMENKLSWETKTSDKADNLLTFTNNMNGESRCRVWIRNDQVSEVDYVLYL
ncbi:MAG: hypothetical protein BMS9Abin26_0969 [Gammaproteobacteria bacterium]|nr:MAG: hypothetical protein BMS9Abin26_0969 [Gammaproteobacteria bacterium]